MFVQPTYQSTSTILPKSILPHKTDKYDLDVVVVARSCASKMTSIIAVGISESVGSSGGLLLLLLEKAVQVSQDKPVRARAKDAGEHELRCFWWERQVGFEEWRYLRGHSLYGNV